VRGLLVSGMNGQLRRGDTLGVWTFNADLYSGQFPLQQWSPETAGAITARALTFLKGQKYAKQPRLDKVLPALNRVVADSDLITVILITAGTENIQGTPFDDKINETYRVWRAEQLKARMPFLTVLRARGGHITECSVNPAPWRVEFPPLPPEPQVAEVAKPQPAPPPKAEPRPTAPPLIIGKKPEPPAPAPTPAAVTPPVEIAKPPVTPTPPPTQAAEVPKAIPTETSPVIPAPPQTTPAAPKEIQSAQTAKSESPSGTIVQVTTEPQPQPKSAPVSEQPKTEIAPIPLPKSAEPQAVPGASITPAAATPPVVQSPAPAATAPAPAEPKPAEQAGAARTESPQPTAVASVAATGAPAPDPQPAIGSAHPETPPVQVAVATPPKSDFNLAGMVLAGLALLAVALAALYLLVRRSRTSAHASLITRSMDHDKK